MRNKKIILWSLINAIGVVIYVSLIAWIFYAGEQIFGKMTQFWGPFAFLLLFVLSTAIVGLLIFGKPVMLYLNNAKKEAVKMILWTVGWLLIATAAALVIQIWI